MKKILLIAVSSILLLTACITLQHIPEYDMFLGIDLRPYTEKGFLITPHAYNGDYVSVFMMSYIIMPEGNYSEVVKNEGKATERTTEVWVFDEIDVEEAVDSIYKISIELGANAISGFKVEPYEVPYIDIMNPTIAQGIQITGMAIKRED